MADTDDLVSVGEAGKNFDLAASDPHQIRQQRNEGRVGLTLIGRRREMNSEDSLVDPIH
jgi:hypothetical protein